MPGQTGQFCLFGWLIWIFCGGFFGFCFGFSKMTLSLLLKLEFSSGSWNMHCNDPQPVLLYYCLVKQLDQPKKNLEKSSLCLLRFIFQTSLC